LLIEYFIKGMFISTHSSLIFLSAQTSTLPPIPFPLPASALAYKMNFFPRNFE
jgi:hypothetical protein